MLTGHRPPIASNILNVGFPMHELESKRISQGTRNFIKHLMSPLWKNRPQSDNEVKSELVKLSSKEDESTSFNDEVSVINTAHQSKEVNKETKRSYMWSVVIVVAVCVIIGLIGSVNGWFNTSSHTEFENYDSDSIAVDSTEDVVPQAYIPNITYKVTGNSEYGSNNSQLCATIDGETVVIGSINYIFGPDNMGNMNIFEQDDFNGDGIRDVIVYDANIGSGGGSTWAFVTYSGDNSFDKSNLFSEASYYEPEIATVNGQKVLDFVKVDMGQRIVKERHGLKNGNAISLDLPKSKTQAYSPLKSIDMEKLGEDGSFYFDLNGDGQREKVTTTGSYHFGRSFVFDMNGREYEFTVENALWGNGTLHILKNKTRGVHDIMIEQDTRLVYKWDGSTYTSEY